MNVLKHAGGVSAFLPFGMEWNTIIRNKIKQHYDSEPKYSGGWSEQETDNFGKESWVLTASVQLCCLDLHMDESVVPACGRNTPVPLLA